jgi:hypothetical protein
MGAVIAVGPQSAWQISWAVVGFGPRASRICAARRSWAARRWSMSARWSVNARPGR